MYEKYNNDLIRFVTFNRVPNVSKLYLLVRNVNIVSKWTDFELDMIDMHQHPLLNLCHIKRDGIIETFL